MIRRPPRSTRTDTLFPYTTRFRSDFTASGTTFIRQVDGEWKGKLKKFNAVVVEARKAAEADGVPFPIAKNYSVHIHHYVSTNQARVALVNRIKIADQEWSEKDYGAIDISEGLLLPPSLRMRPNTDRPAENTSDPQSPLRNTY